MFALGWPKEGKKDEKGTDGSADIPFAAAPTLDKIIANLELMPLTMNRCQRDAMGTRQQTPARRLRSAGLF
ncbi:MAG: hypothetical protein HS117_20480 [Verrucomicrobiaceae bacterium]|nr:hypothetical protein [Verrucomicrobiaceae bacterium]